MRIVTRCLAGIAASLFLLPSIQAEEESRPALVAVPSFQATLPDGTPIYAIVVIPAENVMNKNAAWLEWETKWPTKYRLNTPPKTSDTEVAPTP